MLSREQLLIRASLEAHGHTAVVFAGGLAPLATARSRAFSSSSATAESAASELDIVFIEALEVGQNGDVALPSDTLLRETLALPARRRIVVMSHQGPTGDPRIVTQCRLPVTAARWAERIITSLAVIDIEPDGLVLRELAPGVSARQVQSQTEARLFAEPGLQFMSLSRV